MITDFELNSESGMGDIAILLGWDAPPDDDGFWFLEDHGPVHDSDLRPFLIEEIERLRGVWTTLETLRADGWCVVVKALPKDIGWLVEGGRSEYDTPCDDQRIGQGKWLCEAQWLGWRNNPTLWKHDQFAMSDTQFEAVEKVAQKIAEADAETARLDNCGKTSEAKKKATRRKPRGTKT